MSVKSPVDHTLDVEVSRALQAGLAAAIALMAFGAALALSGRPVSPAATPLAALLSALKTFDATAYLSLGIIVLLATPALRVVVILVHSARRRDWKLAGVAAFVLAVLAASLLLGRAE